MAAKKYQELTNDAKAKVIDDNRLINVKDTSWVEPIIDEEIEKLINMGFVNPTIEYSMDSKPYDGACMSCDESIIPMLNHDIKNNPVLTVGVDNERLLNWIKNQAENGTPIVSVKVEKTGKYVNDSASQALILFTYQPMDRVAATAKAFPNWDIVSKANNELQSLESYGVLADEVNGKIIYGVSRDKTTDIYNSFKQTLSTFKRENLLKKYEEWELYANPEFVSMAKALTPVLIDENNFDGTFRELGFTDQVYLVSRFITFDKLLDNEAKRQYTIGELLEDADPSYMDDVVAELNKFDTVVEENMTAWCVENNKKIFERIKAAYDEATSDSAVIDTLEVNDYNGNAFDDEGNVYNPELDRVYAYDELSPKAKAKVNERYYSAYDFEEFNKDMIDALKSRITNLGFNTPKFKLQLVKNPYLFIDGKFEIENFAAAKNWVLSGVTNVGDVNSLSELDDANLKIANGNITRMKTMLQENLKKVTEYSYQTQTSESAIADFYDGQKFDQHGNEVDE